ncbi:aldose 1-epimerase family protein [Maioricimonas sp. JC845]|uniref:aldose 1-epimerase family protein n=1 Tax=Maioricimonas sp. JC845 TaxID=3232138 RepID=UPI0034574A7D
MLPRLCVLVALVCGLVSGEPMTCRAADNAPQKFVLTSATTNQQIGHFELTHLDVENGGDIPWRVQKKTLHGGKQEGSELITVDNGKLQIVIVPTRGMNILEVRSGDVRLGWDSPVKEVVHPKFIDLDTRGGLGWLDGFNEWMVRCGLEFAGHPGKDVFTTNTGDRAEMDLTLHGKIGNIPSSEVVLIVDSEPPHRLRVRGVVYERMFFGPKLQLVTEISTVPGSDELTIEDVVTNQGAGEQEIELIYHVNYGAPLLEEGAQVHVPAKRIAPMNDHAASGLDRWNTYAGPTPGYIEQVYLVEPISDRSGQSLALLRNAAGDRGTSIRWNVEQLPYFTVWKNTTAVADGYVTGLEPATGYPYNRRVERAAGRLATLDAGESRTFRLDFGLHVGTEAVEQVAGTIRRIQGETQPEILRTPPEMPDTGDE